MSGQFCPDCDHGSMKPAPGPGRHPSRCLMCGWEGDLDGVPYESRISADEFLDDFGGSGDPTVAVTFRIRRGLDAATVERVWNDVSKMTGGGGSYSHERSRHRTFLVPHGSDVVKRVLAIDGVERIVTGDEGLWGRWINHEIHFVRIKVKERNDAVEAAILSVVAPDVEHNRWTQNGDYLLRLMDPVLAEQVAGLEKVAGVAKVIVMPPFDGKHS